MQTKFISSARSLTDGFLSCPVFAGQKIDITAHKEHTSFFGFSAIFAVPDLPEAQILDILNQVRVKVEEDVYSLLGAEGEGVALKASSPNDKKLTIDVPMLAYSVDRLVFPSVLVSDGESFVSDLSVVQDAEIISFEISNLADEKWLIEWQLRMPGVEFSFKLNEHEGYALAYGYRSILIESAPLERQQAALIKRIMRAERDFWMRGRSPEYPGILDIYRDAEMLFNGAVGRNMVHLAKNATPNSYQQANPFSASKEHLVCFLATIPKLAHLLARPSKIESALMVLIALLAGIAGHWAFSLPTLLAVDHYWWSIRQKKLSTIGPDGFLLDMFQQMGYGSKIGAMIKYVKKIKNKN